MARHRLIDVMQSYPFWIFDASGTSNGSAFTVFDPLLGFASVTAPEISVDVQEIRPGNWPYAHNVVKTASTGAISMSRGARFNDSDFYNWVSRAVRGIAPIRRNLVLVHFLGFRPIREVQKLAGLRGSHVGPEMGQTSLVERVPGRAWFLADCIPTRYKAGSDFDATSPATSLTELEVKPEYVMEMTIGTLVSSVSGGAGASVAIGGLF